MESTVIAGPLVNVAAICGSIRKASFHRGLLRSAMEISKQSVSGMQIELLDVSLLPMINTDLEVDGRFPPVVEAFRQKVLEADSILFASPEYNYSVTPCDVGRPRCWSKTVGIGTTIMNVFFVG